MHINANISVELDEDQADEVLVNILMRDYTNVSKTHNELKTSTEKLKPYEEQDVADFESYMNAIETLLKYYMYVGDAEEFINSVKKVYISE